MEKEGHGVLADVSVLRHSPSQGGCAYVIRKDLDLPLCHTKPIAFATTDGQPIIQCYWKTSCIYSVSIFSCLKIKSQNQNRNLKN